MERNIHCNKEKRIEKRALEGKGGAGLETMRQISIIKSQGAAVVVWGGTSVLTNMS